VTTASGSPTNISSTDLAALADQATAKVTTWLTAARADSTHAKTTGAAKRLAAVLSDPNGLDFTVGFVDRVVRTEDRDAAATALADLGEITPKTLSWLDRAQIRAGAALATTLPQVVIPVAKNRIRSMVGHMIVDANDRPLGKAVAELTAGGHRLNINLLGEAVLGEEEADHHLAETRRLVSRPDVDYVSIKASSVASQINLWGYDETVDYIVERLTPLYIEAAKAPQGSKFINLDMEEYRDLRLTIDVFKRLLSLPETKDLEAGIVLQAYLPDALGAMQELSAFGAARVADGGAGIKVRLVKGANLAMETVHAEMQGWPNVTCASKQATDANYKRVLHWAFDRENLAGLRLGVAGHNLFDIAFAHTLSVQRGVADRVEFEMLQGMANDQAEAVSKDVGQLLLYVPAVRPAEFDVAVSYLVRRLEENSANVNFMSGVFDIAPGNDIFRREEKRFRASLADLEVLLAEYGYSAPEPNQRQDRSAETLPETGVDDYLAAPLPAFANEPDTNPALPANQAWAAEAITRSTGDGFLDGLAAPESVTDADIDPLVASVTAAASDWAARPAHERAAVLYRAADILASRRGHLISVAAAEVGKSVQQADVEISEAIDFARYYAHSAEALAEVRNATFTPDRVVLVTPPWNFPLAIPAGGTFAALAAGAGVIHKPSKPTPHCSMAILEALWDAGVPRDLLRGVYPAERPVGKTLVSHPGIDRVILTGSSETAAMFSSWRPGLQINGETSGKNAVIVTPSADRDLAVADIIQSAFGHAGQKCSASSLAILVGSVYESERFPAAAGGRGVLDDRRLADEPAGDDGSAHRAAVGQAAARTDHPGARREVAGGAEVAGQHRPTVVAGHPRGREARLLLPPHRGLRPGARPDACRDPGGGHRAAEPDRFRPHRRHPLPRRRRGAAVGGRGAGRQRLRQPRDHRRDRAAAVLRRLEEVVGRPRVEGRRPELRHAHGLLVGRGHQARRDRRDHRIRRGGRLPRRPVPR
jgi:RHH-type proline utilization regulon transcriptional repressor/proline dehydrogenase/delta 1-pyrroline-5-carboxylate dehydrogenase